MVLAGSYSACVLKRISCLRKIHASLPAARLGANGDSMFSLHTHMSASRIFVVGAAAQTSIPTRAEVRHFREATLCVY